jgi:hypothetical protein
VIVFTLKEQGKSAFKKQSLIFHKVVILIFKKIKLISSATKACFVSRSLLATNSAVAVPL